MDYTAYKVSCPNEMREVLIALFSEHPFDTFEELEEGLLAYIPSHSESQSVQSSVAELKTMFGFKYETEQIPSQNWNAVWESNFQPIVVDNYCALRADFHAPIKNVKHELIIQPKMSFGTGHHATTFQMMQQMQSLNFAGKKVLDYGCGTGVLAILASKEGASVIDAIDIDEWAYKNTLENRTINNVTNVNVLQGNVHQVASDTYDIILANITFNVISGSIGTLSTMMTDNGYLLTSGFFEEDIASLEAIANKFRFEIINVTQKDKWACVLFGK